MTTETVRKCDGCGRRMQYDVPLLQMVGFGRVRVDFCGLDCAILWCTRERDKPRVPAPPFKPTTRETWP
jgi:hypothetical protein